MISGLIFSRSKCGASWVNLFCKYMQMWMCNKANSSASSVHSLNLRVHLWGENGWTWHLYNKRKRVDGDWLDSRTLCAYLITSVTISSLYYKYNVYCGCLALIHARQAIYSEMSSVQVYGKNLVNLSRTLYPYCKYHPSLMFIALQEHQLWAFTVFANSLTNWQSRWFVNIHVCMWHIITSLLSSQQQKHSEWESGGITLIGTFRHKADED